MAKMQAKVTWTNDEIIDAMRVHKPHWVPWPEGAEVNEHLTHSLMEGSQQEPRVAGLTIVVQWDSNDHREFSD